mmetsp:Transcript_2694/g.4282  ORF Transcript_2694/g.4282 Transcript_2694/m.4282 type:complete len:225 (+) Transcript_2694:326-1000(+)
MLASPPAADMVEKTRRPRVCGSRFVVRLVLVRRVFPLLPLVLPLVLPLALFLGRLSLLPQRSVHLLLLFLPCLTRLRGKFKGLLAGLLHLEALLGQGHVAALVVCLEHGRGQELPLVYVALLAPPLPVARHALLRPPPLAVVASDVLGPVVDDALRCHDLPALPVVRLRANRGAPAVAPDALDDPRLVTRGAVVPEEVRRHVREALERGPIERRPGGHIDNGQG